MLFTNAETCSNQKTDINSVLLAVCTSPYNGTNSISSSILKGKIKGKVVPLINELWSKESIWESESTAPHTQPRHQMGMANLFTSRSMCTRGTYCTGPVVHLDTAMAEVRSLCGLRYSTVRVCQLKHRHRHRRWLRNSTVYHNTSLSVYSYWLMCRLLLVLQFKLDNLRFNCSICHCTPTVKSENAERLPGVSWRRAFNSSFDVWPLLLLSTSETPESAGLGGREPGTREHI
jgi:hypothetical protein